MKEKLKKMSLAGIFTLLFIFALKINIKNSEAEINQRFHEYLITGEETQVIVCDGSGTKCKVRGAVTIQPKPTEITETP